MCVSVCVRDRVCVCVCVCVCEREREGSATDSRIDVPRVVIFIN